MKKRKTQTRILAAALAIVMLLSAMPIGILNVSAETEGTPLNIPSIEKYRLDIINGISNEQLFEHIDESFDTESINASIQKSTLIKSLGALKSVTKVTSAGLKVLGHPAIGNMVGKLGEFAGNFIENDANEQLMSAINDLSQQLENVSNQISDLSEQNQKHMTTIAGELLDYEELSKYQATLLEFSKNNVGNDRFGPYKDYYTWQVELHIRLAALLEAEQNLDAGKTNPYEISYYYDNLYIVAKESDILYSYLTSTGVFGDMSLQEIMYRYYLLNANTSDDFSTYIEECITYSEDWYSTYALSQICLNMCYVYQLEELIHLCGLENLGASTDYTAGGDSTVNFSVNFAGEIKPFLIDPNKNTEAVKKEMAKFYARIMCLDESFIYESGSAQDATLYYVQYQELVSKESYRAKTYTHGYAKEEFYTRINNEVSIGDTLYMNVMPEVFDNVFDPSLFSFSSTSSDISVTVNGIVHILDTATVGNSFVISMLYDGECLYEMEFHIIDRLFAGGMGTKGAPYLVSDDWDHVTTIAETDEYYNTKDVYFKLIEDIDAQGANFSGIPTWKGYFDGNGHGITNFNINTNGTHVGFFGKIEKDAIVENLIIGQNDNNEDTYSVKISSTRNDASTMYIGGIAGENYGTILNCTVEDVDLYGSKNCDAGRTTHLIVHVGGIAANNAGTIEGCYVTNSYLRGNSSTAHDTNPAITESKIGCISGYASGIIQDCCAYDNKLYAYAYSVDDNVVFTDWNEGDARIFIGYLVGQGVSPATITNCYAAYISGNYSIAGDKKMIYVDALVPCNQGATVENNQIGQKPVTPESEDDVVQIGLPNPNITEYIQGETHFKYTKKVLETDPNTGEEFEKDKTFNYPISTHRIDTSKVGASKTVVIEPVEGTQTYRKRLIDITVFEKSVTGLWIYSEPLKKVYGLNDTQLDLSGLNLVVTYNNHSAFVLKDEYTVDFNFSQKGQTDITFSYCGYDAKIKVNVICYHDNNVKTEEVPPTTTSVGYTEGRFCIDCQTYLEGHEEIPMIHGHQFGEWEILNSEQHSRACECGEIEYKDHVWKQGMIINFKMMYTCTECEIVKNVDLPYLAGDANGDSKIDLNDVVLIKGYLANLNYNTGYSSIGVAPGADANGDGKIELNDAVLLSLYLANFDYSTGTSSVILGKQGT